MRAAIIVLLCVLVGCEGPAGPTGPQGPQGPAGIQGPTGPAGQGTRATFYGLTNSSGVFTADLPAAAGTLTNPPIFGCYLLFNNGSFNYWAPVGDLLGDDQTASCTMNQPAGGTTLRVILVGPNAGQSAAIVVVY